MRVLVTTFGGDGGKSGVSQYIIQFLRHCRACAPDMVFDVILYEDEKSVYTAHDPEFKTICQAEWLRSAAVNIFWHQWGLPGLCRRNKYDLVFIPGGNRRLPYRMPCPTVVTCHDLGIIHVPDKYDAIHAFYNLRVLPRLLRRQTRILTVSETSKQDIVSFTEIPEERVTVTLNGVDHETYQPGDAEEARTLVAKNYGVDTPYLLYIARIDHPGKNHIRLIEAFAKLKERTSLPHTLVLAGSDWSRADEVHQAAESCGCADNIVFTGFAPSEDLPALYRGAALFVFPSLFEGFGIPVVEAMNCGIPVACANISCLPEIVGDAAVLFDPYDTDIMSERIEEVLTDDDLRARCVSRGMKRAKRYNWRDTVQQTVDIFREVGGNENSN
ncbi:MAG: glycosyltransferase family 4 protein [Candidatus Hydrogenedentes bacterium]|nr:glycosyltransferase family 4 protein [Candidatus Hydrogenedentota bacterium]